MAQDPPVEQKGEYLSFGIIAKIKLVAKDKAVGIMFATQ